VFIIEPIAQSFKQWRWKTMKKFMSFVITIVVLVCTFWLSVGSSAAAGTITYTGARYVWGKGIAFVFEASGYKNKDLKNASLTIGSKSFDLHCRLNKEKDKIVCVAGGGLTQYAGKTGILSVAGHAFYVTIPSKPALPLGNGSLSCPEGTEPGADVQFTLEGEGTWTNFIGGSTLSEVRQNAENTEVVKAGGSIDSIGDLYCRDLSQ